MQIVGQRLVAFPVKPISGVACIDNVEYADNVVKGQRHRYREGDLVPGWAMMADLSIIAASLDELDELRLYMEWEKVYLPRPGCGAGGLDWEKQVKPLCEQDGDWLVVVDRPANLTQL